MPIFAKTLSVLCLFVALLTGSQALYLQSKAYLAQVLMNRAWSVSVSSGSFSRPWPWADVHPVAKLTVSELNLDLVVLDGVSGEAMAFGPGRIPGSSAELGRGVYAIGGHRDTHLAFLQHLQNGAVLELQTLDGKKQRYRVSDHFVADSTSQTLDIDQQQRGLVLITCFPFSATQTGGPLRYVVVSHPIDQPDSKPDSQRILL